MSFDTYANLQLEILAKLNRASDTDAVTRCPSWITLAEDEMRLALNRLLARQGETVNTAFTISSEYTALPSGFYRMRSNPVITSVNPKQVLDYTPPTVAEQWDPAMSAAKPTRWTIQGNQLRVSPAPDASYTATLAYFALPSLSVSNTSNWLLAAHPKIYFKAALAEAYDYYENYDAKNDAQADRDRLFDAIYTSDGVDQQGTRMRARPDGRTP